MLSVLIFIVKSCNVCVFGKIFFSIKLDFLRQLVLSNMDRIVRDKTQTRVLPQSGASERCFTRVDSTLTRKHQTLLERLARDKHYSLLLKSANYRSKKFYTTGPQCHYFKTCHWGSYKISQIVCASSFRSSWYYTKIYCSLYNFLRINCLAYFLHKVRGNVKSFIALTPAGKCLKNLSIAVLEGTAL